jgi:hypothetical protein
MAIKYIDCLEITVADSWVVPSNKTGKGNGEAKIYVGQRTSDLYRDFFGGPNFSLKCRMLRSDLLRFLDEMKNEYYFPSFEYRGRDQLRALWASRRQRVEEFSNEEIWFSVYEQAQLEGPRGYINSSDANYNLLRELPLPGTSILKVVKLEQEGILTYEFRLMPDYDPAAHRSIGGYGGEGPGSVTLLNPEQGSTALLETTVERTFLARIGQERFKRGVLRECGSTCAFTQVNDETLLIAGHIKPWAKSSHDERLDPQNGLALTPTFDKLFDRGLISFSDNRRLLISPLVSRQTASKLRIFPDMEIGIPLLGVRNQGRREYMEFHRKEQFRS